VEPIDSSPQTTNGHLPAEAVATHGSIVPMKHARAFPLLPAWQVQTPALLPGRASSVRETGNACLARYSHDGGYGQVCQFLGAAVTVLGYSSTPDTSSMGVFLIIWMTSSVTLPNTILLRPLRPRVAMTRS
jgi:hypothetical protein